MKNGWMEGGREGEMDGWWMGWNGWNGWMADSLNGWMDDWVDAG